jgi:hypothetical protein
MRPPRLWAAFALLPLVLFACRGDGADNGDAPPAAPASPVATATSEPSPTPAPMIRDIRATRLSIPALNIVADVKDSRRIPYTYVPPPGCPPKPEDNETVTVPDQGIATPVELIEGLENKIWIYGHSRWLGRAGVLFALQDIKLGDEIIIEGFERTTGATVSGERFVVSEIYLADTDSGEAIINAESPADIPPEPLVILQTSVREDGPGKQWILSESALKAKAKNIVEGDLNDYCKYLLLFVVAKPV